MRKIIIFFLVATIFASCSDRYEALAELNLAPVIGIQKEGFVVKNLKDSTKLFPNSYYNLNVIMSDTNTNIQSLYFEAIPQKSKFFYGQTEYFSSLPVANKNVFFNLLPTEIGVERYTFTLTDRFGKTDEAKLELVTFANIAPIVDFVVTAKRQNDPLEYELDGNASKDGDEKYGGKVSSYRWVINNTETLNSLAPAIRYIFPQQGLFKVDLDVKDNEGAVTRKTKFLIIN